MAKFPRDRFDEIPSGIDRVGAHRAPRTRGGGWIGLLVALVATVLLVVGGLFVLSKFNLDFEVPFAAEETPEPTPTETPTQTAPPVTDPAEVDPEVLEKLTISVLNGTATEGLSNIAADQIEAAGWPNPARASASDDTEETTIIFYRDPSQEGIARGIMQLIGAADVELSDAFPISELTIVLGADYVPPAD